MSGRTPDDVPCHSVPHQRRTVVKAGHTVRWSACRSTPPRPPRCIVGPSKAKTRQSGWPRRVFRWTTGVSSVRTPVLAAMLIRASRWMSVVAAFRAATYRARPRRRADRPCRRPRHDRAAPRQSPAVDHELCKPSHYVRLTSQELRRLRHSRCAILHSDPFCARTPLRLSVKTVSHRPHDAVDHRHGLRGLAHLL